MPWVAAAAAGMNMAGGIIGGSAQRDAATQSGDAQKAALNALFAKLDAVGMPPDQSARIILNQYKQQGILTPQLEQQIKESVSDFQNIKQNQQATSFQADALKRMSQLGRAGLTPDERAQMRQLQNEAAMAGQANQQSIIQNMAARGQGGSGAELAARLASSQNQAQLASSNADQVSSLAAQRALQAISAGSNLAGQMESQEFGEQANRAAANDQMNRFNVQNQMNINQRNTQSQNQAQAANLGIKQDLANMNVSQNNQELYKQLERQRQNWLDKLDYARTYSQPLQRYGQVAGQQANDGQQAVGKMWSEGLGGGAKALMSMFGGGGTAGATNGAGNATQADVTGSQNWQFGQNWQKYGK